MESEASGPLKELLKLQGWNLPRIVVLDIFWAFG